MKHPTKNIIINDEKVSIDKEMIPVIQWMNYFVVTRFCCQGDKPGKPTSDGSMDPYVVWYSNLTDEATIILETFDAFYRKKVNGHIRSDREIKTNVEFHNGRLKFCSRWSNNETFLKFVKWLEKHNGNI